MKRSINEIRRMQQLAGIINESLHIKENEEDIVVNQIEDGLEDFAKDLKSFSKTVKPSPKNSQLKEFEPVTTIATLIVGAPGILSFLGKGVDGIVKYFNPQTEKTVLGQALQKAGRKLEHAYIDGIAGMLTGLYPNLYKNQDVHDERSVLHDHAHTVYAAIVGAAAIVTLGGAAHATGIVKGLETAAGGLKIGEVMALAKKIVAA